MVKTEKLEALIHDKNLEIDEFARKCGIEPRLFHFMMESKVFGADDINKIISVLDIDDINDALDIFFDRN